MSNLIKISNRHIITLALTVQFMFLNCLLSSLSAQQARYFFLGEEQFRGVKVYDVIQDKQNNFYFSTSSGIFLYDYYKYRQIDCDESKSRSVFNFVADSKGIIYCHNLNNQIFQIQNGKCKLFYELKKEEAHADIRLSVSQANELIIAAAKIVVIDSSAKVVLRYDKLGRYLGPPFLTASKDILFHLKGTDTVVRYKDGRFDKLKFTVEGEIHLNQGVFKFFEVKKEVFALDLRSKQLYVVDLLTLRMRETPSNAAFERSGSVRLYETKDKIWVMGSLSGAVLLDDPRSSQSFDPFYSDFFISDVYEDNEGNILLSTFDKGVLVVQDLNIADVIRSFREDPVTSLKSGDGGNVLLGTSRGFLLRYNNNALDSLVKKGERPIDGIYNSPKNDLVIFDNGFVRAFSTKTNKTTDILEASLKDVAFASPTNFYLGTNLGVFNTKVVDGKFVSSSLKNLKQRIYLLEYASSEKALYASASEGLLRLDSNGLEHTVKFNGQVIFPLDMVTDRDFLIVSTAKHGVLKIKDGLVGEQMLFSDSKQIEKMLIYDQSLIGKTSEVLFVFNEKGRVTRNLQSDFGFAGQSIIDFVAKDQILWVSHSGGVQAIDLRYVQKNVIRPNLSIRNVYVNGVAIDVQDGLKLQSDQNKIEFELLFPTLRHKQSILYYYKLNGQNDNWNVNGNEGNHIAFDALAAGNYTLLLKASSNGVFTNEVPFIFSISQPFYLNGWFIGMAAILFVAIVYFVYRRRLQQQRDKLRRLNELNASKLTAIQSQMNPHFMFNALNSIQDLVLKGDVENSYSYITTFSNMVRRTLEYSDRDFIEFEQEIALLELYMSLEKLRFKTDFVCTVNIGKVEEVLLPPLIIQPFIENALVHGLLHKSGFKQLKISFELTSSLICTIEDNGVGRKKASEIQQRKQSGHQSFSGKAIRNRFEILSEIYEGQFGYEYIDLYEADEAAGTKVILTIPVKRKF